MNGHLILYSIHNEIPVTLFVSFYWRWSELHHFLFVNYFLYVSSVCVLIALSTTKRITCKLFSISSPQRKLFACICMYMHCYMTSLPLWVLDCCVILSLIHLTEHYIAAKYLWTRKHKDSVVNTYFSPARLWNIYIPQRSSQGSRKCRSHANTMGCWRDHIYDG